MGRRTGRELLGLLLTLTLAMVVGLLPGTVPEALADATDAGTPLTLEAKTAGTIVVEKPKAGMQYKLKDNTKQAVTGDPFTLTVSAGDRVEFYGKGTAITRYTSTEISGGTAECYVYGNVMSLVDETGFATATELTGDSAFFRLFAGNANLLSHDTRRLVLPATKLTDYCYYHMFDGCAKLAAAPVLPATTLANNCYCYMFDGCTSLTTAPELPATTLAAGCYGSMFDGCTSLAAAPALPATALADSCYQSMFDGCTSLAAAPELPATALAANCYCNMFGGCTSLAKAPELPATALANNCYGNMFDDCTSLTAAPALPATTLADSCYDGMFYGCTKLNALTCLATDISASDSTSDWLVGVAATGTFTKAHGMADWTLDSSSGIPKGWAVREPHDLTYSAAGATVTATCSAQGCALTDNKATLTIVRPTLTTYGETGKSASATLTGLDAFNAATDKEVEATDVKYYKATESGGAYTKSGTALASAPADAGTYVAELTISGVKTSEGAGKSVTASVGYAIAPVTISSVAVRGIDAPAAAEDLDTRAATDTANVILSDSSAISWDPAAPQDGKAEFAKAYTATVTAEAAPNHAFANGVTATVNGNTATVTMNQDGTLAISYAFAKTGLAPVAIAAADREVAYSPDGVAIPMEGMFAIPSGAGDATYSVTNGTGAGTYDAKTRRLAVTKCGTFTVKASTAASGTHAAGAEVTATLTVKKADPDVTAPKANALTHTGKAQELVTAGSTDDGTMYYAVTTTDVAPTDDRLYATSVPTATDAGTYYVWYKVVGDDNHSDVGPKQVPVTIAAIPTYTVTFKVKNGTWSDGGTADKTETVQSGSMPASVPTGMKASEGYAGGAWDTNPASATITGATTFTYTFTAKGDPKPTPTPSPVPTPAPVPGPVQVPTYAGGYHTYGSSSGSSSSSSSTASTPAAERAGMHRMFNPGTGEHFYTASDAERDDLVGKGWSYEGIAFWVPKRSNTPVWRLFNPATGEHYYTTDTDERDRMLGEGWSGEGVAWYADDARGKAMYRLFDPKANPVASHHFTSSESERQELVAAGWTDQGVGFYALG